MGPICTKQISTRYMTELVDLEATILMCSFLATALQGKLERPLDPYQDDSLR